MKIAAYVNSRGNPVSLYEPGALRLYEAENLPPAPPSWRLVREIPFAVDRTMGLPAVKAAVHALGAQLEDCRSLVSGEVRGMIYTVFQEELGFTTWKSTGPLVQQLDSVQAREKEQAAQKRFDLISLAGKPMPTPLLIGDPREGSFWIDLKEALEHPSGPTSRQILIPFLEKIPFRKLEIVCDHLPKWLAWELERLDMSAESDLVDVTGNGLRVTVYPRNTPEGRARKVGLLGAGPALCLPCPREKRRRAADLQDITDL
ncbi:Fe-only nitrogenase accessory protein AnfO [Azospira inquinata]|uniref:Fe-only nitrogenase accessory protein AnfO n=1 Tax=Azospira inquinata TaxID=2785627 RepID=A0A975SNW2_9RHOO|nr:Fe-only nitrogenase accessory protein AnfO [Azospira inquinata]QWT45391.1 Fe-only nitrogenase accessory protein AnfO [Azospira inquinata]QWT49280.1 Fe-only nitrogenase accessory protein AnfO [Azospira inquinata]